MTWMTSINEYRHIWLPVVDLALLIWMIVVVRDLFRSREDGDV